MYIVAIIGDVLSLVPVVNILSDVIVGILLWSMGKSGSGFGTGVTFAGEAVPLVGILPLWTLRVFIASQKD